ncbi:mitochondrial ribosomal subunit S27-domain-containing protein, partial [Terfezia claveryi]
MSVLPSRARLLELAKTSCRIFSTTFNPTGARTGNKILRQRLRGPNIVDYYPKRMVGIADLRRIWPDRVFIDEAEVMRLEDVQVYVFYFLGQLYDAECGKLGRLIP